MSDAVLIKDPRRVTTLADLIDSWCGHVLRFRAELDLPWSNPALDVWGVDDLIAAFYLRDAIEDLLDAASESPHALALADEDFVSITRNGEDGWLALAGFSPGSGWWWERVPSRGPITEQLASMGQSS